MNFSFKNLSQVTHAYNPSYSEVEIEGITVLGQYGQKLCDASSQTMVG
jgi:hypothetical protein